MHRFPDLDPLLELRLLELDAQSFLERVDVAGGMETEHGDGAGVRATDSFDAFHRGGLAGAVGPNEAKDLAVVDVEGDVIDCYSVAVGFAKGRNPDDGRGNAVH